MKRLEYSCEHEWSLSKRVANICIFVTGLVVVAVAAVYVYSAYTDTSEEDEDEDEQPVWIRRVMIGVGAAEIVVLIFVIREYLSKLWKGESKPEMKTPKPA